jgi:hypothetical protein
MAPHPRQAAMIPSSTVLTLGTRVPQMWAVSVGNGVWFWCLPYPLGVSFWDSPCRVLIVTSLSECLLMFAKAAWLTYVS